MVELWLGGSVRMLVSTSSSFLELEKHGQAALYWGNFLIQIYLLLEAKGSLVLEPAPTRLSEAVDIPT